MSKIAVMPEDLSNRIAAGEVIERPASVVKELAENAIDAGATRITVEIEHAGTRLIRVSDNGCGMDEQDALLCLAPHGTSKLKTESDLNGILTLGFRGEAVPSIASVSRMTLETRTGDAVAGMRVEVDAGRRISAEPAGCAPGTVFTVRDLFFNVPARKKFLRSAPTEQQHIEETVLMLALPHPEIAFELISDGRISVQSPGEPNLNARLRAFFGKHFADQMLPVNHIENGMHISGFIAAPGFARPSRREQRLFVNRRAVDSQTLYRGVRDGYGALAEHGRFPPCILFVQISPDEVDVNVHPAKREVRFHRDFAVSRAVQAAVQAALKGPEALPQSELDPRIPLEPLLAGAGVHYTPRPETGELFRPEKEPETEEPAEPVPVPVISAPETAPERLTDFPPYRKNTAAKTPSFSSSAAPSPAIQEKAPEPLRAVPSMPVFDGGWPERVIGILNNMYILAESGNGLVLIDQHAAHERILFEKLLAAADRGMDRQQLLIPLPLELPRPAADMLLRTKDWFGKLGFEIEDMGGRTVMLNAVPAALAAADMETLLLDTLNELAEESGARIPLEREHVARAACRAAVKAGDTLTPEMASELLKQLASCHRGMLCPHGRPTMLTLSMNELARRFGRK